MNNWKCSLQTLSEEKGLVDGCPHLNMSMRGTRPYLVLIESNIHKMKMVCPSFTRKRVGRMTVLHTEFNLPVFHLHSIASPVIRALLRFY